MVDSNDETNTHTCPSPLTWVVTSEKEGVFPIDSLLGAKLSLGATGTEGS